MTTDGQSLMQAEDQKRKGFTRVVSFFGSIPVLGVGIGLLYFAAIEPDLVYLSLFAGLGLVVTLFGFLLLLQGIQGGGKRKYTTAGEIAAKMEEEGPPEVPANQCPHCGAEVISAGKFCGKCGKSLQA